MKRVMPFDGGPSPWTELANAARGHGSIQSLLEGGLQVWQPISSDSIII